MSLRDNRLILGVNPECVPSHRQDNDWWLSQREDTWAAKKEEDSYCLVKMGGALSLDNPAKDWDWQEEQIHQMGEAFQRAPTRIIVNSLVFCYMLNKEKYLEKHSCFGPEMDADWCFLITGWDRFGINLGHWLRNDWGGYWGSDLRVCLSYRFEF